MAEMRVAGLGGFRHRLLHCRAVVAVEGVALDIGGMDGLAAEDLVEGFLDRGRAGTGGARDRDDRVLRGHGLASCIVEQATLAEEGRALAGRWWAGIVAGDALDLVGRPEDQRDALVQVLRHEVPDSPDPVGGRPPASSISIAIGLAS